MAKSFKDILIEHFKETEFLKEQEEKDNPIPFIIKNSLYVKVNDDGNIDIGIGGYKILEFKYEEKDGKIKVTDVVADKSHFDELSEFLTKDLEKKNKKEEKEEE